ncbi:hypothetical protein L9F63_023454, partial [Diploptera punctata]
NQHIKKREGYVYLGTKIMSAITFSAKTWELKSIKTGKFCRNGFLEAFNLNFQKRLNLSLSSGFCSCCRLPVPNLQSLRSWASSMLSPLACISVFMLSFHINFDLRIFFSLVGWGFMLWAYSPYIRKKHKLLKNQLTSFLPDSTIIILYVNASILNLGISDDGITNRQMQRIKDNYHMLQSSLGIKHHGTFELSSFVNLFLSMGFNDVIPYMDSVILIVPSSI